jgi:hypothetical protein
MDSNNDKKCKYYEDAIKETCGNYYLNSLCDSYVKIYKNKCQQYEESKKNKK